MNEVELPKTGEIVIVKITKVLNYGAFCELLEYKGVNGFIHLSEIASGWIKNIRNHVKENQLRAGKILFIHYNKNEVDLSLNKVPRQTEKQKIDEFNQFVRAKKLIEVLAKKEKESFDSIWEKIAVPLMQEYGSINDAFKKIALEKEKAVPSSIPNNLVNSLVEIVSQNIAIQEKELTATITVSSSDSEGLIKVKNFFNELLSGVKREKLDCYYKGSGKYAIIVKAIDYKKAEKTLKELQEKVVFLLKKHSLEGSFQRAE